MKVFLMVLNSLAPSSMHIVQEKDDIIDIKREKYIIKKGIVREETENLVNKKWRHNSPKKKMID